MIDLKKFFVRSAAHPHADHDIDPDSDYHPSDKGGDGLEVEYQSLIATQFRRWGIPPACITIEVRRLGQAPDGFDVFVGMVRLVRWDRDAVLRVLLGLPLLETKVRKTVRATWLADFSHFAGLWLHASEHMQAGGELRDLITQLTPFPSSSAAAGGADATGAPSSLPASLMPPASEPPVSETA
jgi:hypothetical protein